MSSRILAVPLVLSIAFLGCGGETQTNANTREGMEQAQATPAPTLEPSRTLTFEPANGTKATGTLVITDRPDGAAAITVDIDGLSPGAHAWHVHNAPCGSAGQVVLPFTDIASQKGIAEPLVANDQGHASGTVTITAEQLPPAALKNGKYSIHIHKGAGTDPGETVACVTLR